MTPLLHALIHGLVPPSLLVPREVHVCQPPAPRQGDVLLLIGWSLKTQGRPPSVHEVCEHFGWSGNNSVATHYAALERKGYVVRPRAHAPHGVQLTPLGQWWVEQHRRAS